MKNTKLYGVLAGGMLFSAIFAAGALYAEAAGPNILVGRDLSVGATGPDVTELQGILSELGYLNVPAGIPLGYFGGMTKTALASYQATLGVINTGYFGPLTKQALTASFGAKGWLRLLYPLSY